MSENPPPSEEEFIPRRSSRRSVKPKQDDDFEYEDTTKKNQAKKNQAKKRKAPEEEAVDNNNNNNEEQVVVAKKPSTTVLLASPPRPKETKKSKKRKTKKEKDEEQRESLKLREKLHKEMEEANEIQKRNMEEMIKRENEKKRQEEEQAKMKKEEEDQACSNNNLQSSSSCSPSSTSTTTQSPSSSLKSSSSPKSSSKKKAREEKKKEMSDDDDEDEEEKEEEVDESCGFTDLQRLINTFSSDALDKPVLIHGGFVKVLKPHQLEGIRFCWKHISNESGCVLAHSMGLGKTLQMIALVHTLMMSTNRQTRNFLIVCPKSVVLNWDAEFDKWIGDCVNARIPVRTIKDRDKSLESRLKKLEKWANRGGILILSFQMFHRFLGHYSKEKAYNSLAAQRNQLQIYRGQREAKRLFGNSTIDLDATIKDLAEQIEKTDKKLREKEAFEENAGRIITERTQLIIVDEAHRMCSLTDIYLNQALKRMETQKRIALTGTPVQNNLTEYYAMINWVKKDYWTNEEWYGFFSKPIQSGMRKDSDEQAVEEMKKSSFVLVNELEKFIHRRDQTVLRDSLPPKSEYVISFRVNPLQAKLYKAFADARQKEERRQGNGGGGSGLFDPKFYSQPLSREQIEKSSKTLFFLSVLLNKITNHPDLVRMYCDRRGFTLEDALKHPGVFITREEMQEKRALIEALEEEEEDDDESNQTFTPPKIKKSESPIKQQTMKNEPTSFKRESPSTNTSKLKNEPISLDDDDEDLFSMDLLSSISSQPKTPASSSSSSITTNSSPFSSSAEKVPKKEESEQTTTNKPKRKTKKEEKETTPKSKRNRIKSALDEDVEDEYEQAFDSLNNEAEEKYGNNLYWATPVLTNDYKMFSAKNSPKMEFLMRIIEKCYLNNEKILVFSQYVEMLDVMEGVFKHTPIAVGTEEDEDGQVVPIRKTLKKGDDYLRLDGSISGRARQDLVDSFTPESTANVFIISTKAGGLGINLVAATRVVIFDCCWNDTWDKQALFRTYRYGQTKPVFVYRFVTYGSAEEKIFNLSTAKAWLAKRIVDDKTPDLIMKKGDLEILTQALSIEETMSDKLLLNPKHYQEDPILKDLLGVKWEYSEDVIDPLKPVHITIDEEEEKEEQKKPAAADTFYPPTEEDDDEDMSGEFNVERKIKSVFRYESLFVETDKLRLRESEQERSITEYEQKRKDARENPGKLLAEIMADDMYDPSFLMSPTALLSNPSASSSTIPTATASASQQISPNGGGPIRQLPMEHARLNLLARLQQFIFAQDNTNSPPTDESHDDMEAASKLSAMWATVSSNPRVMQEINRIRKRRQRNIASQGLSSSSASQNVLPGGSGSGSNTPLSTPSVTPQTFPQNVLFPSSGGSSTPLLTPLPSSFTFDALNHGNQHIASPFSNSLGLGHSFNQSSSQSVISPLPSSIPSSSSRGGPNFSIPIILDDDLIETNNNTNNTRRPTPSFPNNTNSISIDSDDDE